MITIAPLSHLPPSTLIIIFKMDELDYNSSEDDSVESRAGDTDMELGDLSEDEGDLTPGDVVEEDGREAEHDGEN